MDEVTGTAGSPHTRSHSIAEVLAREQVFAAAVKRRDRAGLESILAPEFKVVVGGGPEIPRETWLENALVKGDYGELEFKAYRASIFAGLVVVDAGYEWMVSRKLPDGLSRRYCVTGNVVELWERRQGDWQILWRHTTRVAEQSIP